MKRLSASLGVSLGLAVFAACDSSVEIARESSSGPTTGASPGDGATPNACADAEMAFGFMGYEPPNDGTEVGFCLEHALALDEHGLAPCVVFEFVDDNPCSCDESQGRLPVPPGHVAAYERAVRELTTMGWAPSCVCELHQASSAELTQCDWPGGTDPDPPHCELQGFAYADGTSAPSNACAPPVCAPQEAILCLGPVAALAGARLVSVCSPACIGDAG